MGDSYGNKGAAENALQNWHEMRETALRRWHSMVPPPPPPNVKVVSQQAQRNHQGGAGDQGQLRQHVHNNSAAAVAGAGRQTSSANPVPVELRGGHGLQTHVNHPLHHHGAQSHRRNALGFFPPQAGHLGTGSGRRGQQLQQGIMGQQQRQLGLGGPLPGGPPKRNLAYVPDKVVNRGEQHTSGALDYRRQLGRRDRNAAPRQPVLRPHAAQNVVRAPAGTTVRGRPPAAQNVVLPDDVLDGRRLALYTSTIDDDRVRRLFPERALQLESMLTNVSAWSALQLRRICSMEHQRLRFQEAPLILCPYEEHEELRFMGWRRREDAVSAWTKKSGRAPGAGIGLTPEELGSDAGSNGEAAQAAIEKRDQLCESGFSAQHADTRQHDKDVERGPSVSGCPGREEHRTDSPLGLDNRIALDVQDAAGTKTPQKDGRGRQVSKSPARHASLRIPSPPDRGEDEDDRMSIVNSPFIRHNSASSGVDGDVGQAQSPSDGRGRIGGVLREVVAEEQPEGAPDDVAMGSGSPPRLDAALNYVGSPILGQVEKDDVAMDSGSPLRSPPANGPARGQPEAKRESPRPCPGDKGAPVLNQPLPKKSARDRIVELLSTALAQKKEKAEVSSGAGASYMPFEAWEFWLFEAWLKVLVLFDPVDNLAREVM